MIDYEKLQGQALAAGFTHCAPLDVGTLEFMTEVRDMCSGGRCPRYDKSWACPPVCGTLDEMRERASSYSGGLLVQTVGELEDSYDWEGLEAAAARQRKSYMKLWDVLEAEYPDLFAMGTGGCGLCETCTYPDEPCRFPERKSASMEACGLLVNKVCTDNGLAYNYGPNKIAYTACFLLK